jgi:TfoX N-terminal domain
MTYEAVAARVREFLAGRADVTEQRMVGGLSFMVGGLSFMVGGHLCCGVTGDALMVRMGPDDRDRVLAEEHVRPMEFGRRRMAGFVCVDPAGYATDDALAGWVQRGLDFVSALPARPAAVSKSRAGPPARTARLPAGRSASGGAADLGLAGHGAGARTRNRAVVPGAVVPDAAVPQRPQRPDGIRPELRHRRRHLAQLKIGLAVLGRGPDPFCLVELIHRVRHHVFSSVRGPWLALPFDTRRKPGQAASGRCLISRRRLS